jgi:FKBP-type peptidyl-prolyl cis-trans isomerase 2
MGIFEGYKNVSGGGAGRFLKGEDFTNGITLKVVSFEKVMANKPEFGAQLTDSLVKKEILKVGETFNYNFTQEIEDEDGFGKVTKDKVFNSKSAVFFFAFKDADPEVGDNVFIKRTGMGKTTKYEIKKVK